MATDEKLQALQKLESLVKLMDTQFSFAGFSFGIDAIIGLIPGIGDIAGGCISVLIILRIRQIGVSEAILSKMIRNVLIDVFMGSVPLLGDIFDVGFKVNKKTCHLQKTI